MCWKCFEIQIMGLKNAIFKNIGKSIFLAFFGDFRPLSVKISHENQFLSQKLWAWIRAKINWLTIIWGQSLKISIFCLVNWSYRVLEFGSYESLLAIKTLWNFCHAFCRLCTCILTENWASLYQCVIFQTVFFEKIGASLMESDWLQSFG